MEKVYKKIRIRTILLAITFIIIGLSFILLNIYQQKALQLHDFNKGFQFGLFIALELILVFHIIRYLISMRDKTALRKLYIKENDERTKLILQKSGAWGMTICYIGLAFGSLVASFFNQTVFLSLLGATVFTGLIKVLLKIYYSNIL